MTDVIDCPAPTRREAVAGYTACLSAAIGFIPMHLAWGLGSSIWAREDKFREWYDDGGGVYLHVLNGMAVLAAIFALSLIRPWGVVFPRWVPLLAGRRVPRWPVIGLAGSLSVSLFIYTLWAFYATFVVETDPSEDIFDEWIVYYGIPQFLVWSVSLMVAGWSYYRRTSPSTTRTGPVRTAEPPNE
ncbi:hypothetical protein [Streptomyces cinnamoneus]|uniref:DUF3995 domain-containing protein n=1 Tax=Streptomyces cinnamoneus TaxID=53446 RepID=A0A918TZ20_STRCJ|nr:hypothetical protein [Streptomyces cinnamoneus]GHC63199.1 hypothetical protein GCM10010507_45630 [Streptomyces cinnamoneus]